MAELESEVNIPIPNLTESQKINVEIIKNLVSLNTSLNDIKHKMVEHDNAIDELDKIMVRGNGETAIRETVRADHAFILEIRYWIKFIFGAVIIQSIGMLAAGIYVVIRVS